MYKKTRIIHATVVIDIQFYLDDTTIPEDVLDDSCLYVNSEFGMITKSKLIHSAITKDQKLVERS